MIFLLDDNMKNVKVKNNLKHLPTCVGFIMDGNRRWAREQGFSTEEGHRAGAQVFERVVQDVRDAHISHAVFYAFSTENWQRAPKEVQALMGIFMETLQHRKGVRVRVIGERDRFSEELCQAIEKVERETVGVPGTTIWVALSYGGRQEIVTAVNRAIANGQIITEEEFAKLLYTNDMPDPDLIIRTGGEQRLSNFLSWQSVYSELIFTDTLWPAFTKDEFFRMLAVYEKRQRRHGK